MKNDLFEREMMNRCPDSLLGSLRRPENFYAKLFRFDDVYSSVHLLDTKNNAYMYV